MLTAIYLQRRRILFGMFFFFLAGLLHFGRFGMWEFPLNVIVLSVIFALICGTVAGVLIPLFPAFRQVFEIAAVAVFITRSAEAMGWVGEYGMLFETTWGFLVLAVGFTLLQHFVYGTWWQRTPIRLSWSGRSRFHTSVSPHTAWARLVPGEDQPGDYYTGTLHEFRPMEEGDFSHLLRLRMGGPQFVELLVKVTRNDTDHAFAYDFSADVSPQNRDVNTGHWQINLTPHSDGTAVEVIETVFATTPANALFYWFDDLGGQVAVSMKRVLEESRDPTILGWQRRRVQATA